MTQLERARAAQARLVGLLQDTDEVCGIGIARDGDEYVVKVNVSRRPEADLPDVIDGIRVTTEVVGDIRTLPQP